MAWNFNQLERAALSDNLPAIVEALVACPSTEMFETPAWVTRKARDWIIKLLRETQLNGHAGQDYLKQIRQNMIDARRYEIVADILKQQPEVPRQIKIINAVIKERKSSPPPDRPRLDPAISLKERNFYLRAIGASLQSACAACARLLAVEGLEPASAATVLRSYKKVEPYELDGPYYIPLSVPVRAAFRILGVCRSRSMPREFERALLAERYSKLRETGRRTVNLRPERWQRTSVVRQPQYLTLPWALEPPKVSHIDMLLPEHALEYSVRCGNVFALVSGLDQYNRSGGPAPSWLLQSAAWRIIALLKRTNAVGERSILTESAQRLIDCERHLLIEKKQQQRIEMAQDEKRDCERAGLGQRATTDRLRSLGLLYSGSLDTAIRETLSELQGTPLEADFEAAKKSYNRVKKAPHLLREHWLPPENVARLLDLPIIAELQKVGNEYPRSALNR